MESKLKQVIVLRKDLGMRAGKMVAQGAHASLAVTLAHLDDPRVQQWLSGQFTKVVVRVESEDALLEIDRLAEEAGLPHILITDSGLTEFAGVPTKTCVAVGPATHDELLSITGQLKLL